METVDGRRLLRESFPISAILLVSFAVGAVSDVFSSLPLLSPLGSQLKEAFVLAGIAAGILYVLSRGPVLARAASRDQRPTETRAEFTEEALVLALPIVSWFAMAGVWEALLDATPLEAVVETLVRTSTWTGMLTAALYLLARGITLLSATRGEQGAGSPLEE